MPRRQRFHRITLLVPRLRGKWAGFSLGSMLWVMLVAAILFGWYRDRTRLLRENYDLRNTTTAWSTAQVLGPPDTRRPGDQRTAWAPKTQDGQAEWLLLDYDTAVTPTAVVIHENYNPGAVTRVTAFTRDGKETELWSGVDPTAPTAESGVSELPVTAGVVTQRIKVYIDSPAVAGWNEIDAVGLQTESGKTHWATKAEASSSYGSAIEMKGLGRYRFVF